LDSSFQRRAWTTCSAVGAGDAGDAAASPNKIFWTKLIRFGHFSLDLGKIKTKFGQN